MPLDGPEMGKEPDDLRMTSVGEEQGGSGGPGPFYRVRRLPPYVFERVNKLKAGVRAQGAEVVDLGGGNPARPPRSHIVEKLVEVARNPRAPGYSTSKGVAGL